MRKYLLILFTVVAVIATSCQKDEKLILGKWEATNINGSIYDDDGTLLFSGSFSPSQFGMTMIIEFKKDNTYYGFTSFMSDIDSETETGNYTITDNTLIMDGGDIATIKKLTKKEMVLEMAIDESMMTVTFKKM